MKGKHPDTDWDEHFASRRSEEPETMTPIKGDEFERSIGGLHGFWEIREHPILTSPPPPPSGRSADV